MKKLVTFKQSLVAILSLYAFSIYCDSSTGTTPKPPSTKPTLQSPVKKDKEQAPPLPYRQKVKPELPAMSKPFGMPGVIGLQNNKWDGTDYLGYLSNNIGIDVEILKQDNVPNISDNTVIENLVASIFTKEGIIPNAEVAEGPPLPFLHLLFIVYPVEKDRYVIFGNGRLFEQIQVIRKNFIPAGYWQGITWENQDITLSSSQNLDLKMKELATKLGTAFAKRYRQYNLSKEGLQGAQESSKPNPDIQ